MIFDGNEALKEHCEKIALTTGKLLGVTALSSAGAISLGLITSYTAGEGILYYGLGGSFVGMGYHCVKAYYASNDKLTEQERFKHIYWKHVFMGVLCAPICYYYIQVPCAIPSILSTCVLITVPTLATLKLSQGSQLPTGVSMAINAVICGSIGVLIYSLKPLSIPDLPVCYLGATGAFTGLAAMNAYAIHEIIRKYNMGTQDYMEDSESCVIKVLINYVIAVPLITIVVNNVIWHQILQLLHVSPAPILELSV